MIILILILGLILRLINLNQSLWLDEGVQAITSLGPITNISTEMLGDFHPPLYHYFMWFYVHVFGSSEIILRLPSVIFGVATIYAVYLIAKNFPSTSLRAGKFAETVALFLAVAPFHIYYSQEARPYALVTLLITLSMYFFITEKRFRYIIATALALYSSYYVLFILLIQILTIIIRKKYYRLLHSFFALLLFLPWLPMFFRQLETGREALMILPQWGTLANASLFKAIPLTFIKFIIGRITIFDKTLYAVTAAGLFVIYGTVLVKGLLKKQMLINLWFAVPIIFSLLLSISIPNFQPFRLLFIIPAFYLLLAFGLSTINNRLAAGLAFGLIILVSGLSILRFNSNSYFWREDWRGLVSFVEAQNTKENPSVALLPSSMSNWPWKYYSESKIKLIYFSDKERLTISRFRLTVYYIRYLQPLYDPNEQILTWLKQSGYNKVREISFNQIPVWEYKK